MRRHATGWVAKLLFAFLILSFAVWGIGDIFRAPQAGGALAEVAGSEVTSREVTQEFDRRLRALQAQAGSGIDRQMAVSFGLLGQALDAAVARHLLDAHGRDLGLAVGDETLAEQIRNDPQFQGPTGFERERFTMMLRALGTNEEGYLAQLRQDVIRGRLVESMTGPLGVPDTLVRELYDYRNERRRGEALVVRADAIEVAAPADDVLQRYLEDHQQAYEAPEYRTATLVVLKPEDLASKTTVPEADVRAAYDARAAQYRTPEQRTIEQLLAQDEATIKDAAGRAAAGASFTEVTQAMGSKVERTELGPLAKGDLPEGLDQATFSLAQGAVSQPVQSPFGWHLIRVTEIKPETVQSFESVKDELARELALERAHEELPDFATKLDDEIAAGTPLDTAATQLGIEPLKLERIDRTGHTPAQERLAADRLSEEILTAIFAAAQGETSLLQQTRDGSYYMYRVESVEAAHPRTLAEVRDKLVADWTAEEQRKQAKARAEELKGRATSPDALAELAKSESGVELKQLGPVPRSDTGELAGLGPAAVALLFATEPGQVAKDVAEVPGGSAVVATQEVLPAQADEALLDATRRSLVSTLQNELLAGYEAALRGRYPVTVNQAAMAQLMEQQAQ